VLSDAKQKQEAVRSTLAKYSPIATYYNLSIAQPRREDIPGALEIALDSTPYGPNEEEAGPRPLRRLCCCTTPHQYADICARNVADRCSLFRY
ncbi:hypothetical protein EV424DRAFT_1362391, partial [Suillus variegatus]